MTAVLEELRFALRSLRKAPVLSVVAVITLGLGIGMNALMFSLVYGALYRGLPFPEEEKIVRVIWSDPSAPNDWLNLSVRDYADIDAQQNSIADLAGIYTGTVNLSGMDRPVRYNGGFITANGFDALRVQPVLGRTFLPEEGLPGAPLSIILGQSVWESRFNRDPGGCIMVEDWTNPHLGCSPWAKIDNLRVAPPGDDGFSWASPSWRWPTLALWLWRADT